MHDWQVGNAALAADHAVYFTTYIIIIIFKILFHNLRSLRIYEFVKALTPAKVSSK